MLDHVDKARDLAIRLLEKMQEFDPGASSLLYATQVPTKGFKGGPEATSAEPSYRGSVSPEIPQIDLLKLVDQLQRENTELRSKNKVIAYSISSVAGVTICSLIVLATFPKIPGHKQGPKHSDGRDCCTR